MNKKNIILIISVVLVVACFLIPSIVSKVLPTASVTKVKEINYVGYVTATGEVVQKDKQQITSDYPLIVSKLLVNVGDTIKKGQAIVDVDKEQTAKKIMATTDVASMAGLTTGVFATSYEDALTKIPAQIISNLDGVVDSIDVKDGGYIEKGGVVLSLIGEGDLVVNIQVPENKISNVKVGQPVEITGSGFESKKYYGYVESISTTARKVFSGTNEETVIDVVVSIDNLDDKIKAGYTTKTRIITAQKKQINVIPYESVMQDAKGKEYVYVFSKGLAIRKDIQTGMELGEGVEVISGVNPQEIIISSPNEIKSSGKLVKIAN